MLDAGLIVSRFLHYTAALLLFGGALFPLYASVADIKRSLKGMLLLAALLALASLIGWFLFAAATMAGTATAMMDVSVLITIIKTMGFGKLWIARSVMSVILIVILLRRRSRSVDWIASGLGALLLVSLAGTGHAQEPQTPGWQWHIVADGAHLLAAGAWLGGLCALALTLRTTEVEKTSALLLRFSVMGEVAVAVLFVSGLVNSWFLVGSLHQLVVTTYGILLSAKIALFLAMSGIAAANRFWITPNFARPLAPGDSRTLLERLRMHVLVEQMLGLCVVAVVSLLGTLQPAALG